MIRGEDAENHLNNLTREGWLDKNISDKKTEFHTTEKSRRFIADMIRDFMDINKYVFTFNGQKELETWVRTGVKTKNVDDMIDIIALDLVKSE